MKTMRIGATSLLSGASALAILVAAPVAAQESAEPAAAGSRTSDVITVTAQRREQTLFRRFEDRPLEIGLCQRVVELHDVPSSIDPRAYVTRTRGSVQ